MSKKLTADTIRRVMSEMGSRGGRKAAENLTKKQRVERATIAVQAREAKRKAGK